MITIKKDYYDQTKEILKEIKKVELEGITVYIKTVLSVNGLHTNYKLHYFSASSGYKEFDIRESRIINEIIYALFNCYHITVKIVAK